MKYKFWQYRFELFFVPPIILMFSITCIILGFALSTFLLIIFGVFIFLLNFFYLIFNKKLFSLILISPDGIKVKLFKKIILKIDWDEIIEIKASSKGKCTFYLTIISESQQINIDPSKKLYNSIINSCPSPQLIFMLNNIEHFKCFHKTKH